MTIVCKICNEKRAFRDSIVYDDYGICCFCLRYYENKNDRKKEKKFNDCDVYTLKLSQPKKKHYSLIEWGQAKAEGKVLVIEYDFSPQDTRWEKYDSKLFTYLMRDSKQSFSKLSKSMKESVLKYHPSARDAINKLDKSDQVDQSLFEQYKEYLKSYTINQEKLIK